MELIQLVVNGIALGAAYALVALDFVLVLNATGTVNFAQGDLVMTDGFVAMALAGLLPWPGILLLPLVLALMALFELLFSLLAYFPLRNRPPVSVFISTIAAGYVSHTAATALLYAALLAILFFRPQGLFGEVIQRRAWMGHAITTRIRLPLPAAALGLAAYTALFGSPYTLRVLTVAGVYALLVEGYQFVFGYVGALSLAQGTFFGLGAYATGILGSQLGWTFAATFPLSVLLPLALAAAIAGPVLRLATHYFALATLGIGQVVLLVAVNWERVTGGAEGSPFKGPSAPADPCQPSRWCPRREQGSPASAAGVRGPGLIVTVRPSEGGAQPRTLASVMDGALASVMDEPRASRPRAKVVGRRGRQTRGSAAEELPIRSVSVNGPNPAETVRSAGRRAHRAALGARAASAARSSWVNRHDPPPVPAPRKNRRMEPAHVSAPFPVATVADWAIRLLYFNCGSMEAVAASAGSAGCFCQASPL